MGATTHIEWCDATFNPWIGCTKVSPGCAHCYAEMDTRPRVLRSQGAETWGRGAQRVRTSADNWKNPVRWARAAAPEGESSRRTRVFCASLADWLDAEVPAVWLAALLDLIRLTPELDWLLLTKRPELWRGRMEAALAAAAFFHPEFIAWLENWIAGRPPANIWIGVTVEDQPRADARREAARSIPARLHFVSYEPALEQVDWAGWEFIAWMIMGGESGTHARCCQVEWLWAALYWCRDNYIAPFIKQLGAAVYTQNANAMDWPQHVDFYECSERTAAGARVGLHHRKGGDIEEFPTEFRVRDFPRLT